MNELIYDVGMHRGEDTAHYLAEGFRVVAVEANPVLCDHARQRFAGQLADGRLTLVEAGVHEAPSTADFWICESNSVWSSFDKSVATRRGSAARKVTVECLPFDSIVRRYGKAHYIKIDIEGHDQLCLDQLPAALSPDYISVEFNHDAAERQFERLHELGYTRFKLICQSLGWANVTDRWLPLLSRPGRSLPLRALRLASHLPQWLKPLVGRRGFARGSSGPIGSRTRGMWRSLEEVMRVAHRLQAVQRSCVRADLGWWFDIHATRAEDHALGSEGRPGD